MFLVWIGWKFYPVLKANGGFKELINLRPIGTEKPLSKESAPAASKEKESTEKKETDEIGDLEGDVDVEIDEENP